VAPESIEGEHDPPATLMPLLEIPRRPHQGSILGGSVWSEGRQDDERWAM